MDEVTYTAGALEGAWTRVPAGRSCDFARSAVSNKSSIVRWLAAAASSRGHRPELPTAAQLPELSRIVSAGCSEAIEPLVGNARHPLASPWPCDMRKELRAAGDAFEPRWRTGRPPLKYETEYLLLGSRCGNGGAAPVRCRAPSSSARNLFYDLGCSNFGRMHTSASLRLPLGVGPSIPLFHAMFARNCIEFDRIWAWEAQRFPGRTWWRHVPPAMAAKLTFYNEPVNLSAASALGVLAATARAEDYVVLKLDIDSPQLERQVIERLAATPALASLVDELFFEYHVHVDDARPLSPAQLAAKGRSPDSVQDAIALMQRLRRLGVRSHFWV